MRKFIVACNTHFVVITTNIRYIEDCQHDDDVAKIYFAPISSGRLPWSTPYREVAKCVGELAEDILGQRMEIREVEIDQDGNIC